MKKIRITKQVVGMQAYSANPKPNVQIIEEECVDYILNKNEVVIISENLERAKEYLDKNLEIGDTYIGPIESIDVFYDEKRYDGYYKKYCVLADPYYVLEENINGQWIIKDKHGCSHHNHIKKNDKI